MERLKVAIIGAGSMGKNHARIYSTLGDVKLIAICDINKHTAKEVAQEYSIKHYSDCEKMISQENLDAVSVCVPTKFHKDVAIKIIKGGINLLIEKPISKTVNEAKQIINESRKYNVKLMIGHIERFNPVVTELKKMIERNELGKIYKVHSVRLSQFPQRIIDVGVIVDLAIHEIDILKYLIDSKIIRVFAETAQRIHSHHEDLLIGTLRFENSILGVINANWLTPKKVREITVTGEKGMFVANYLTQELYFYKKEFAQKVVGYNKKFILGSEAKKKKIRINHTEPLKNELMSFAECILKNKEPLVTGEDGLEALDIAQKFLQSARENKVINL